LSGVNIHWVALEDLRHAPFLGSIFHDAKAE
jgi:hypothetical protein